MVDLEMEMVRSFAKPEVDGLRSAPFFRPSRRAHASAKNKALFSHLVHRGS